MSGKSLKDEVNMRKANTERFMTPEERKDKYQRNLADSRKLTIIKRHLREKGYSVDDLYDSIIKDGLSFGKGAPTSAKIPEVKEPEPKEKIPVEVSLKDEPKQEAVPKKEEAKEPEAKKTEAKKTEPVKEPEAVPKQQDIASLVGATTPVSYIPPKPKADPVATRIVLNPWGQGSLF